MSGGGKKPFAQKGTGNARQGSSRTPLRPGGGVAFGPKARLRSLPPRPGLDPRPRPLRRGWPCEEGRRLVGLFVVTAAAEAHAPPRGSAAARLDH